MGRRLRGPGSPMARKTGEPPKRRTMEITILEDLVDRIDAVHSRTGIPKGQIIEAALEAHLAGVRVASVPDRLLTVLGLTPGPGKSEGEEATPDLAVEPGQDITDLISSPPTLATGGGEGGASPPARPKVDHAAARARIGARTARRAS